MILLIFCEVKKRRPKLLIKMGTALHVPIRRYRKSDLVDFFVKYENVVLSYSLKLVRHYIQKYVVT